MTDQNKDLSNHLNNSTNENTKEENIHLHCTLPSSILNDTLNQNQMKNSYVTSTLEQTITDLTIPLPRNNNDLESSFLEKEKSINHEQIDVYLEDDNISDNNKTFQQNEEKNSNENNLMDTTSNTDNIHSDDFESGHGNTEHPMLIESLPNYQMIDETNLDEVRPKNQSDNKSNLNEVPPKNQSDNESTTQIPLNDSISRHPKCQFHSGKSWIDLQYHDQNNLQIKKPDQIGNEMDEPTDSIDQIILDRIQGSIIGMALGDALGAHVEFRPHQYLKENPVKDLGSGGTWGLDKGQFTDDTSMALCLANSLVARRDFIPYDQLVRYKWWYNSGYMSSTGQCFDIGAATRQSIVEFQRRQKEFAKTVNIKLEDLDYLSDPEALNHLSDPEALDRFDVYCSEDEVAGNGALMRLAPVPLFFYRSPAVAVEFSGISGQITHGDQKAYDACRYYGALIVAALQGSNKDEILDKDFYLKHKEWFGENELHSDIKSIAEGSYQKENGYDGGIRGKGYIVNALEAALWAFWSDENSFEKGALAAVNLGDDTDTTAAIYGQLAGAYYGYKNLPEHWLKYVYAKTFMEKLSKWIVYEGEFWQRRYTSSISQ